MCYFVGEDNFYYIRLMVPATSHIPAPPTRLAFSFEFQTRFGRPLFDSADNLKVLHNALQKSAAEHGMQIRSIRTTSSTATVDVEISMKQSASLAVNRLKTAAAIALRDANPALPELRSGGVFHKSARIIPIAPKQVPTNAEPDSSEPESLAVSRGGADSTASALSGSASRTHVSESSDA